MGPGLDTWTTTTAAGTRIPYRSSIRETSTSHARRKTTVNLKRNITLRNAQWNISQFQCGNFTIMVYFEIDHRFLAMSFLMDGFWILLPSLFHIFQKKNLNFALEAHVHVFIKRWALRHSDMSLWNIRDQPFLKEKDREDQKQFPNNCTCGFVTQHLWKEIEV